MRKHRKVTVDGVTLSTPEWAAKMDITIGAISRRVYTMGWSWEKAVSTPRRGRRYIPRMKFGKWTLLRDTGVRTKNPPRYHIWEVVCDCGFQTEYPVRKFSPSMEWRLPRCPKCDVITITAKGKTQTLEEWSEETGLSTCTLRERLKRMDPENAISKPKNYHLRWLTFKGKTKLMSHWAKEIGITKEGLRQRLREMSVEKALTKPVRSHNPPKEVTARGETKTIVQWVKETGTAYHVIYARLRIGWTDEEAVFGRPKK